MGKRRALHPIPKRWLRDGEKALNRLLNRLLGLMMPTKLKTGAVGIFVSGFLDARPLPIF